VIAAAFSLPHVGAWDGPPQIMIYAGETLRQEPVAIVQIAGRAGFVSCNGTPDEDVASVLKACVFVSRKLDRPLRQVGRFIAKFGVVQ
jgi:hypothetical protein